MRVLVCGDRNWKDRDLVWAVLTGLYNEESCKWMLLSTSPFVVVSGMAKGADSHAAEWAIKSPLHGEFVNPFTFTDKVAASYTTMPVALRPFPANWEKYGKAAGPIRNQQMLDEGNPDLVIGFNNNINESKGTKDMLNRAYKAGIKTILIGEYNGS